MRALHVSSDSETGNSNNVGIGIAIEVVGLQRSIAIRAAADPDLLMAPQGRTQGMSSAAKIPKPVIKASEK